MDPKKDTPALDLRSPIAILICTYVLCVLMYSAYASWTASAALEEAQSQIGVIAPAVAETTKADADGEAAIAALKDHPDYLRAAWDPIHFKPAIETATNEQCLACHKEVLTDKPRTSSPAGLKATDLIAWYETLDTYSGEQATFHARHLSTPFAKEVMNLQCNFCHQGHDRREEAPSSSATAATSGFSLRKVIDPSSTCLLCHGKFPGENMGFEKDQKWHDLRNDLESEETPNGCLTCHAEQFRTVRHQVTYLKADEIEKIAKSGSSDSCFGCHGGRAWYRKSFPYPRHSWPGMDTTIPDWAKDRPTTSDVRYLKKQ